MKYRRLPIEIESPEEFGYDQIKFNLSESSYADISPGSLLEGLDEALMSYGDHWGHPELRAMIAQEREVAPKQVVTAVGAAHALFMINQTLIQAEDEVVITFPNYSNNLEMPKVMGAQVKYLNLGFDNGFQLTAEELIQTCSTSTKLISLTTPHNPSGVCIAPHELNKIISYCDDQGIYLLLDLTYLDLDFNNIYQDFKFNISPKVITVSSLSKSTGLPGIRLGWLCCSDDDFIEKIIAIKEQSILTHSSLDEGVALNFFKNKTSNIQKNLETVRSNFLILKDWMAQQNHFEWIEPNGGCIGFPRIKEDFEINLDRFYRHLVHEQACYVGPGHWFDFPDNYMRIGFGYPNQEELQGGLEAIEKSLHSSLSPS